MTTARSSRGLALLGLVAALGAQAAPAPRLALEQQTIEFGEVILGQSATFSVGFTNAGDAPLELTEVEPSCGCTVSEFPRAPIAPGGKGTLSFRFDSARRLGPQALTVKIYSNDPTANELGQGCTILHLRGEVRSLFRLRPAGAFFGEWVRGSELAARVIHVVGVDEAKGKALGHALSAELPDYLQASARPWTSPEGEPGVIVGDCGLAPFKRRKMAGVLVMGMMCDEGWRGVGLGRAMLASALDWARANPGVRRVELGVLATNPGAMALYRSLGFVQEGLHRGRFRQADGSLVDDLAMALDVSDA